MTHLRTMMLEELQRRNYAPNTIKAYVRIIQEFAQYFHRPPDQLGPQHLRQYQAYLFQTSKLEAGTVQQHVAALRFFYVKTLKRRYLLDEIPRPKRARKLPVILSPEEVAQLIDAASNLFHRTMLMTLYSTGVRRAELCRLRVTDIDSPRMMVHIHYGRRLGQRQGRSRRPARGLVAVGRVCDLHIKCAPNRIRETHRPLLPRRAANAGECASGPPFVYGAFLQNRVARQDRRTIATQSVFVIRWASLTLVGPSAPAAVPSSAQPASHAGSRASAFVASINPIESASPTAALIANWRVGPSPTPRDVPVLCFRVHLGIPLLLQPSDLSYGREPQEDFGGPGLNALASG